MNNCKCNENGGCGTEENKSCGCGHDHQAGCGCGHNHEEEVMEYVELFNDKGEKEKFIIIANFGIDEKDYAILAHETNEDEVIIFSIVEENDEFIFETVDDENELERVVEAYNELIEEGEDQ